MIGWPIAIRSTANGSESKGGKEKESEQKAVPLTQSEVILMWCCSRLNILHIHPTIVSSIHGQDMSNIREQDR